MQKTFKMLILALLTTSSLQSLTFDNLNSNNWNWIAVGVLTLLFFILLISIIRDIKNNTKKINSILIKEKNKTKSNNNYINDINNARIDSTEKLKNSIEDISKDELKSIYKELYLSNHEEEIFLKVLNDDIEKNLTEFKLKDLLENLTKYDIVKKPGIISSNHHLIADESIITDIFFLLSKHQTSEHNYKIPKFEIELDENNNNLIIKVSRNLKLNRHIKQVLSNNIEPIYSKLSKKYYGIYLYLIKKLVSKINAKLTINASEETYMVTVTTPVDIKYEEIVTTKPNRVLKEHKRGLILTDEESSYKLYEYLKGLNFDIDRETIEETNKEIPNFMDYDIAFIDSRIFEPILTEYLQTIKKYSPLKVVAILSENNKLYPSSLVDETVDITNIDKTLYQKIEKLYGNQMVEANKEIKTEIKPKVIKKKQKGQVLIASDDIANLHILEYMIKEYGIEVVSCRNGIEVLNLLKKERFDLIILDSVMPKLDGYQTIQNIRENEEYNSIPVIIHTSFSTKKSSMSSIFKLGFDSYLPKPFNKKALEELLERYVPIDTNFNKNSKPDKHSLKEFIAIYGDSDKMLEKYIKERREKQALLLIKDLQSIATKIEANNFIDSLNDIENALKEDNLFDNSLIYSMSDKLQQLKTDILKELSA